MNKRICVLAAALLASAAAPVSAELVVIVNAKNSVSALTEDQASAIFLGKARDFPGGGAAAPIDQAEGSAQREEFHSKVTGKSGAQLKAYWSKLVFTGKGQAPKEVADAAAVKAAVAANPNAVGYVDKGAVDGSVKAVMTVK